MPTIVHLYIILILSKSFTTVGYANKVCLRRVRTHSWNKLLSFRGLSGKGIVSLLDSSFFRHGEFVNKRALADKIFAWSILVGGTVWFLNLNGSPRFLSLIIRVNLNCENSWLDSARVDLMHLSFSLVFTVVKIAFISRWSWVSSSQILVIAQIIDSLGLAHVTKEQPTFDLGLIAGCGWDLLGKFCCIIGKSCALRSEAEISTGRLPG